MRGRWREFPEHWTYAQRKHWVGHVLPRLRRPSGLPWWDGQTFDARVHDHTLTNEEIAARVMSLKSDSPERRARASMRLSEEIDMNDKTFGLGPPELPVTRDNWKLTPLTENQFSFIHEALTTARAKKTKLIDEAIQGVPVLEAAMPDDVKPNEIPVLTWANPKEMERLIEFAHNMREERNEARLAFGAVRALAVKEGIHADRIHQAIKDTLTLGKQINRNLVDTPALAGYRRASSGYLGKSPGDLPKRSS